MEQQMKQLDERHSMTPDTNDYGVTPPNADTLGAVSNSTSFTGSHLDFSGESGLSCKSDAECESRSSHFTGSTSGPELSVQRMKSDLETNDLHNHRPNPNQDYRF